MVESDDAVPPAVADETTRGCSAVAVFIAGAVAAVELLATEGPAPAAVVGVAPTADCVAPNAAEPVTAGAVVTLVLLAGGVTAEFGVRVPPTVESFAAERMGPTVAAPAAAPAAVGAVARLGASVGGDVDVATIELLATEGAAAAAEWAAEGDTVVMPGPLGGDELVTIELPVSTGAGPMNEALAGVGPA